MKRTAIIWILILCMVLSACGVRPPERTADGQAWDPNWTTLGNIMGVDPMEGWSVQRSEDVLAAEGMFYTVWTAGDAVTYTNENGDQITAYDAEIHLVAAESKSAEDALQLVATWETLADERYPDSEKSEAEYAGQEFAVSVYPGGASATGTRGSRAIRVDVTVREDAPHDPVQVLADFLSHCHYAQ